MNFGRASEITRDELKFTKFIGKLRRKFSMLFNDLLKTQLILKGVMTAQDWDEMVDDIQYRYAQDAYYTESKDQELLRSRIEILGQLAPFDGQYVTKKYIQNHVLRFTQEEVDEMNKDMEEQKATSMDYSAPLEDPNQPGNILTKGAPFPASPEGSAKEA